MKKAHQLWADKQNIPATAPVKDAWCEKCCDTAALHFAGKWHCGSCGTTEIELAADDVPDDFKEGMRDIAAGRVVDL